MRRVVHRRHRPMLHSFSMACRHRQSKRDRLAANESERVRAEIGAVPLPENGAELTPEDEESISGLWAFWGRKPPRPGEILGDVMETPVIRHLTPAEHARWRTLMREYRRRFPSDGQPRPPTPRPRFPRWPLQRLGELLWRLVPPAVFKILEPQVDWEAVSKWLFNRRRAARAGVG